MDGQQDSGQLPNAAVLPPDTTESPSKRPRVSEACGNCRTRKTKCDGRKPICRACEQRSVGPTCNYDYVRRKRARSSLETPTSKIGGPIGTNQYALSHSNGYPTPSGASHDVRPGIIESAERNVYPFGRQHGRLSQASASRGMAPYHGDGTAVIGDEDDDSSYGPSATVAFLRSVVPHVARSSSSRAIGGRDEAQIGTRADESIPVFNRRPIWSECLSRLPVRNLADNFFFCYWEFMNPLFPVLHKPSVERMYERLWMGDKTSSTLHDKEMDLEEVLFMSTLNVVFAIGCQFTSLLEPAQKPSVANDFYLLSRNLFGFDLLDASSIPVLQLVFLRGAFLQATPHANRSWNCVGLSIRIAQSLGIHLDSSSQRTASQLEREMQRRIWHSIVMLDRVMALAFGRPPMVTWPHHVPFPAAIDDDYLSEEGEGRQPPNRPSYLGCFVQSCHLLNIMQEVLELINRTDRATGPPKRNDVSPITSESIGRLIEINRHLDSFAEELPDYLRITEPYDPTAPRDDHILLQQQVLYCRFLIIRLSLLRPVLLTATKQDLTASSQPLGKPSPSGLDSNIILNCCELCTSTAYALIHTVYEYLGTSYRSAAWHSVYFTFSSAIALLASTKVARLHFDRKEFEKTWSYCLAILRHYESQITSARHAVKILESAKAQVMDEPAAAPVPSTVETSNAAPNATAAKAFDTPASNAQPDYAYAMDYDDSGLLNAGNLADAWYSQQLYNLAWFDLQPVPNGTFFLPEDQP